ncbi:DNA-binding transcriptional regulator [Nioella sp.]|jgi:IclR family mhp operon transcriptional activator|uniref:DNA-binding transcriptional regulator n=1 Tax=Nioella sp. TaxID=1912091 RepID=UPI003A84EC02
MSPEINKVERKYDAVRALTRGLDILRYINETGACKAADIARELSIPRPTVYRLLETLEQQGYVAFSPTSARVRVTRLAGSLGDGFGATSELCQIAGPLFTDRSSQIAWPLDLTVYENTAMIIQETTHSRNPLSIDSGMTGYRLPMLRTSAGRCYLAHCPREERQIIIRHLQRKGDPDDLPFLDPMKLDKLLQEVKARGFGVRLGLEFRPKTSSIAVPVMAGGRIVCCVSVIWTRGAMNQSEAIDKLVPPLLDLSRDIAQRLDL